MGVERRYVLPLLSIRGASVLGPRLISVASGVSVEMSSDESDSVGKDEV